MLCMENLWNCFSQPNMLLLMSNSASPKITTETKTSMQNHWKIIVNKSSSKMTCLERICFKALSHPHLRATDGGDVKSGAWITFFAWKMWYVSVECGIAIGSLVEFFSSTSPFQPLQHTAPDFWMQVDPNFQWGSHDSLLPFPPVMQIKCLYPVEWFVKMIHLYYILLPPQKRNAIFIM